MNKGTSTTGIESLLSSVSIINQKYEDIAKITGENFNIFNILGMSTDEVRTHSALLAELFNVNGSHGLGKVFLDLLLCENKSQNDCIGKFVSESSIVTIEKHIGFAYEDASINGRIDIIIEDKNGRAIIIENKIYAGDQEKQLQRYYDYGKVHHPNGFALLYLTLDGHEPSFSSKGGIKDNQFICISYKSDIINWLVKCKEKAVGFPVLRETISQYINLLKKLTNQSTNNKMKTEISELIVHSPANLEAAFEIEKNVSYAKDLLLNKLMDEVEIELKKDGLVCTRKELNSRDRYKNFSFSNDQLQKNQIRLNFDFEAMNNRDGGIGINWLNEKNTSPVLKEKFQKYILENKHLKAQQSNAYPMYWWFQASLSKSEYLSIMTSKSLVKKFSDEFLKAFEIAKSVMD